MANYQLDINKLDKVQNLDADKLSVIQELDASKLRNLQNLLNIKTIVGATNEVGSITINDASCTYIIPLLTTVGDSCYIVRYSAKMFGVFNYQQPHAPYSGPITINYIGF